MTTTPPDEYWAKIAILDIEAELDGRRVTYADVERAGEMAALTFRSVLEAKDYELPTLKAYVSYNYRAAKTSVGGGAGDDADDEYYTRPELEAMTLDELRGLAEDGNWTKTELLGLVESDIVDLLMGEADGS